MLTLNVSINMAVTLAPDEVPEIRPLMKLLKGYLPDLESDLRKLCPALQEVESMVDARFADEEEL